MTDNPILRLKLKSSIFDRDREIVISSNQIEYDDNDLVGGDSTRFEKQDINAFRYGVKWVRGVYFIIGRIYSIDIMDKEGRMIKIRLKSMYGVRKSELCEKYVKLVNALYINFFDDIARSYLTKFENNEEFELCGLKFSQAGITLDSKSQTIPWEFIGTRSYRSYYTIFPESNPNSYKAFTYLDDWNAGIVYSVSRTILKSKGFLKV